MTKRSRTEERKVQVEYDVGVIIGSIRRFERRKRGVEVDIKVGRILWRRVGRTSEVGQVQSDKERRQDMMDRGCSTTDVRMML